MPVAGHEGVFRREEGNCERAEGAGEAVDGIAPRGSSSFSTVSRSHVAPKTTSPASIPMKNEAWGVITSAPAVIATSPPSTPFTGASGGRSPSRTGRETSGGIRPRPPRRWC